MNSPRCRCNCCRRSSRHTCHSHQGSCCSPRFRCSSHHRNSRCTCHSRLGSLNSPRCQCSSRRRSSHCSHHSRLGSWCSPRCQCSSHHRTFGRRRCTSCPRWRSETLARTADLAAHTCRSAPEIPVGTWSIRHSPWRMWCSPRWRRTRHHHSTCMLHSRRYTIRNPRCHCSSRRHRKHRQLHSTHVTHRSSRVHHTVGTQHMPQHVPAVAGVDTSRQRSTAPAIAATLATRGSAIRRGFQQGTYGVYAPDYPHK